MVLWYSIIFHIDSLGKQQHEHSWNNGAPVPLHFRLSKHSEQHFTSHLGILALEFQDCQKKKREHRDTAQRPRRRRRVAMAWWHGVARYLRGHWKPWQVLTGLDISTFLHFLFIFFDFDTCPHSTMSTFHVFDTFCLTEIVTEEAGDGHQDPLRHEEGGRFSKRFKDFFLFLDVSCRNSWMYPEFLWFPLKFHRIPHFPVMMIMQSVLFQAIQARAIWPSTFRMRDMWSQPCRSDSAGFLACGHCGHRCDPLMWPADVECASRIQDIQMRMLASKWIWRFWCSLTFWDVLRSNNAAPITMNQGWRVASNLVWCNRIFGRPFGWAWCEILLH